MEKQSLSRRLQIDWQAIDSVLLDMDGTLLDRHFDDYFWEHYVPEVYARQSGITPVEARKELLPRYQAREGTLAWSDLDFWSRELELDIPALKLKIEHLIQVHPYVEDFLQFCRQSGKWLALVTNAHSKTLAIKMERTVLGPYFHRTVCAEEVGMAKENPAFWERLEEILGFDRERTMLADDSEKVLQAARQYGMGMLIFVARPSSREEICYSRLFPSIVYFKDLIPASPSQ